MVFMMFLQQKIEPVDVFVKVEKLSELVDTRSSSIQDMITDLRSWIIRLIIFIVILAVVELAKLITQAIIARRTIAVLREVKELLTVVKGYIRIGEVNKELLTHSAKEVKEASVTAKEVAKEFREEIRKTINGHGSEGVEMHGPKPPAPIEPCA